MFIIRTIVPDIESILAIEDLVGQVKTDFGKVDVLFVNAGIFQPDPGK